MQRQSRRCKYETQRVKKSHCCTILCMYVLGMWNSDRIYSTLLLDQAQNIIRTIFYAILKFLYYMTGFKNYYDVFRTNWLRCDEMHKFTVTRYQVMTICEMTFHEVCISNLLEINDLKCYYFCTICYSKKS